MADSTEELRFRAVGEDVSAGRMMKNLGDKADDAKDEIRGLDRQLSKLDEQVDLTALHMKALIHEFDETGDKSLFRDIRKDRSQLALLQSIRKELRGVGDDSDKVGRDAGRGLLSGISDTLSGLPSLTRGSLIAGAVGVGAAMAPFIGAAISGAVLGGVGIGGIIGGVALAAQDSTVQKAGQELGQRLVTGFTSAAQPFVGPLLEALETLEETGRDATASLGRSFTKLAPLVSPVARGLSGLTTNILPGFEHATAAAAVPVRALANELPDLGDAVSDFLDSISSESDSAAEGIIGFSDALEGAIRGTGEWLAFLGWLYGGIVKAGDALHDFTEEGSFFGEVLQVFGGPQGEKFLSFFDDQVSALDEAKASTDTYVGSVDYLSGSLEEQAAAAKTARNAMVDLAKSIEDQFDPTANLIRRLQDVKDAQDKYNEAIKEHGRNSREAREAELAIAEAILAANSAAAAAAGTFDGKFDPALHKILKDGGLTEAQIRDIEAAFRGAHAEADKAAKTYRAQLILDTSKFFGSLAAAKNAAEGNEYVSGRASGGPVAEGKTYMVGENGPELVTFGADGYVHDAASTQAMLSGSSGGSSGGWSGGAAVTVTLRAAPSGNAVIDALMGMLRAEIQGQGGDVQLVLGSSTLKG